jgi:hypothetical protein
MAGTGQLSEDGLWEWQGKGWGHVSELAVPCPECSAITQLRSDSKSLRCSNRHEFDFVACSTCRGSTHRAKEHRSYAVRCPYCGASEAMPSICRAWDWAANQAARGAWPPGRVDSGRRSLTGLTLSASSGTQLRIGVTYNVDFTETHIRIASESQAEEIGYDVVRAMEITDGPTRSDSERNRDIAGGAATFGLIGALAGAATPTFSPAVLRIVTSTSEYMLIAGQYNSLALRSLLTPAEARIRQAQTPGFAPAAASSGVADELTKLAQLRDSGVLSDAEFAAAKARLLGIA